MSEDRTAYCVEGCGRPAETSRPLAMTEDGDLITELVCWVCRRGEMETTITWFTGRVRCPECRHYCADHAACSREPGGAGAVIDCSCAHGCHLTGHVVVTDPAEQPEI